MVTRAKKYYLGALTQEENLEKRLQKVAGVYIIQNMIVMGGGDGGC